jgi:hypothetical protein
VNLKTPESQTASWPSLTRPGQRGLSPGFRVPRSPLLAQTAFSLIEILVVVALLSFIILGLMAMFDQTKKAFTTGMTQVDVLENGRAAMEIISRELSQMIPAPYDSNAVTFYAEIAPVAPLWQPLPGNNTEQRRNVLEEMFFLTRETNSWRGIGYWIGAPDTGNIPVATANGWGTLYRYQTNSIFRASYPWQLYRAYNNFNLRTQRMNRIIDGVVHFKVRAYDPRGVWITNNLSANTDIRPVQLSTFATNEVEFYRFTNNAVPAFVEFELGILEERALARVKSIPDLVARRNYLKEQVGRVHIFRTRVPVRNVDPAAYQ